VMVSPNTHADQTYPVRAMSRDAPARERIVENRPTMQNGHGARQCANSKRQEKNQARMVIGGLIVVRAMSIPGHAGPVQRCRREKGRCRKNPPASQLEGCTGLQVRDNCIMVSKTAADSEDAAGRKEKEERDMRPPKDANDCQTKPA